jgi:hypothetical protein
LISRAHALTVAAVMAVPAQAVALANQSQPGLIAGVKSVVAGATTAVSGSMAVAQPALPVPVGSQSTPDPSEGGAASLPSPPPGGVVQSVTRTLNGAPPVVATVLHVVPSGRAIISATAGALDRGERSVATTARASWRSSAAIETSQAHPAGSALSDQSVPAVTASRPATVPGSHPASRAPMPGVVPLRARGARTSAHRRSRHRGVWPNASRPLRAAAFGAGLGAPCPSPRVRAA